MVLARPIRPFIYNDRSRFQTVFNRTSKLETVKYELVSIHFFLIARAHELFLEVELHKTQAKGKVVSIFASSFKFRINESDHQKI